MTTDIVIREARREDAGVILGLIRQLAVFEKLEDQVRATEEDILRDGFGQAPRFECLIAEVERAPVGFALFFNSYSTFEGSAGLYLEDVYVAEEARGLGVGRRLLETLAELALRRGLPRLDLSVLEWNPARDFYARLGFEPLSEWRPLRLSGKALRELGGASRGRGPSS